MTADMEGSVTNQRLQQLCTDHTADITRLLQDLVGKGFLEKDGYGRWASYRLSGSLAGSNQPAAGAPDATSVGSQHSDMSSQHNDASSQHSDAVSGDAELLAIAAPAHQKARLSSELMRGIIRSLCAAQYLSVNEIATLVKRHPEGIRNRFLSAMVREGSLLAKYADPTHPEQAYLANPDWKDE